MIKENIPRVSSCGKKKFFHFLNSFEILFLPSPSDTSVIAKPFDIRDFEASLIFSTPKTTPINPSPFSCIVLLTNMAPSPSPFADRSSRYVFLKLKITFSVPSSSCSPRHTGSIPNNFL